MKRIFMRTAFLAVLLLVLGSVSVSAVQPICLECFNLRCYAIFHDGYNTCVQLSSGCIAYGECTINLTISE